MITQITVCANSILYCNFLKIRPWKWKGDLTSQQSILEFGELPHILGKEAILDKVLQACLHLKTWSPAFENPAKFSSTTSCTKSYAG